MKVFLSHRKEKVRSGQKAERNISRYLINFIQSNIELDIRAGIPQGSVLGQSLWIVFYDDLLRFKIPGRYCR